MVLNCQMEGRKTEFQHDKVLPNKEKRPTHHHACRWLKRSSDLRTRSCLAMVAKIDKVLFGSKDPHRSNITHEISHPDFERIGHNFHRAKCDALFPILQSVQVRAVEPRSFGKLVLRHPHFGS